MLKIQKGLANFYKKKTLKATGTTLFKYIAETKIAVDDKILDEIKESKGLKHQPQIVKDFFLKIFKDVKVEESSRTVVVERVKEIHRSNHIPFSTLTPKTIILASKLIGNDGDFNIFKIKIENWETTDYKKVLETFLNHNIKRE